MAHRKTCAICELEYIVSKFDRQDPYVCQDCVKWLRTRKGKTVANHKTKYAK